MKKKFLAFLTALILTSAFSLSYAKVNVSSDLANAIKLYKAGNYSQCYEKIDVVIKHDPTNALAYYYKAMTAAQIGKKAESLENYDKAIALAPKNGKLIKYAQKGKRCIENPSRCNESQYVNEMDRFIRSPESNFSEEAKSTYDRLKIENMMRNMNRSDDIEPREFREYKDFSSMNTEQNGVPSNDEIVAAIRTLQKAGLYSNNFNSYSSDISLLTGNAPNTNKYSMLNMMGNSSLSPEIIQAMLTNNMSLGF